MRLLKSTAVPPRYRCLSVLFVVGAPMAFFLIDRLVAHAAILDVYATKTQRTWGNSSRGFLLGLLEDLLASTLMLLALGVLEAIAVLVHRTGLHHLQQPCIKVTLVAGRGFRILIVMGLVVLTLAPFAADMLLLRTRGMRFTMDLIATYAREKDQASSLEVEPREVRLATSTCVGVGVFALLFTVVYVRWIDLRGYLFSRCHHDMLGESSQLGFEPVASSPRVGSYDLEMARCDQSDRRALTDVSPPSDVDETEERARSSEISPPSDGASRPTWWRRFLRSRRARVAIALGLGWIVLFTMTHAIAKSASPLVAAIALNATLNELVRSLFHTQFLPGSSSGDLQWVSYYLKPETEAYELFQDDVLFRKTTGFVGPLAFDVTIEETNPPNVLVLAVESFRYMDSLLMTANTTAGELMQKHNLTVTPQFDRWAQRGIAFNNMWSSWQTSRSLEAILFGQIAYDSVTDSGTTHGQKDTKLSGMPQLFKQKGYETVFSTGCIVTYDQWDAFLPSHGFDSVMAAPEMKAYAEKHYNITKDDWDGPAHRGFNWGVHDDVSFDILGDVMILKTQEQAERVKRGEKKRPFFLNHYTISSHHTFDAHPTWLESEKMPDFSALCEGWESECDLIQKYAKLRFFTDMELGKFMDRMKTQGVLEDTIVVIVGDHGQSPEMGLSKPIVYQTAVTHVASTLVAEGRLGKYSGMVFEDATHHYDLLNTLADIVGVPKEGFLQKGVGRSLKRKIPFGERVVWSNNPMKKMSVVRGHERFVYDRASDDMGLFDMLKDPLEKANLLASRSSEERASWEAMRSAGRELSAYFRRRWDQKCLAAVAC